MGRPTRQFVAGYPVHVVQRGNDRQNVFGCDSDYRYLWRCLREAADESRLAVNAYVFMTNHIHLLVTPRDCTAVSRVMHAATGRYSGYFNTRYGRSGALWEGRFRASIVTRDFHFLACHRYIDLNPVRARLVPRPEDYAWSSHRFYAHAERNPLVTPHDAILDLGFDDESRRLGYVALFAQPLDNDALNVIRSCTQSGRTMGEQVRRGRPRKIVPGTFSPEMVPDTF